MNIKTTTIKKLIAIVLLAFSLGTTITIRVISGEDLILIPSILIITFLGLLFAIQHQEPKEYFNALAKFSWLKWIKNRLEVSIPKDVSELEQTESLFEKTCQTMGKNNVDKKLSIYKNTLVYSKETLDLVDSLVKSTNASITRSQAKTIQAFEAEVDSRTNALRAPKGFIESLFKTTRK